MFKFGRALSVKQVVRSSKFSTAPDASFLASLDVTERVLNVVRQIRSTPPTLSANDHFVADLQFDSLIRKNLNVKLMEEFCLTPAKGHEGFLSVRDAVAYFSQHPKAR